MTLTLGLDVGTQGTKGLVLDPDRGVVARASAPYDLLDGLPSGAAEQHPHLWRDAVQAVVQELLSHEDVDRDRLVGVGVSGQQHGCVLLGEDDEPVRAAKLWCDTVTADEAAELGVATGFTASKVLWTRRHEPEVWARTRRVLLPHDYVNLLLSGEASMEAGDASGTGWFDLGARRFDEAAMDRLDAAAGDGTRLAERLPGLTDPTDPLAPIGRTTGALGLPAGLVVAPGGGDNMMSALGSGATRAGTLVVSLGTSGTAFAHADAPVVDPDGLIAPFCGSAGGWLPLLCVMNLTGVTEEVRAGGTAALRLAGDPRGELDHAALTDAAAGVPAGCDGLLWLPYLAGERVPDLPRATGTLLGMRPGHLRPGVLYRAALEGTSLNLARGVTRLRGLGLAFERTHLVGGAAANPLWRAVLAACLDTPLVALEEPESAALGAALQALGSWHREAGAAFDLHDLAAPLVREGDPTAPDPTLVGTYAGLAARFGDEVARLYG